MTALAALSAASPSKAGAGARASVIRVTLMSKPASSTVELTAARPSSVRTARRRYVPLFWRVLALNAAVVSAMAVAIAVVLPTSFTSIAVDDAVVLAVALAATLAANTFLLRRALSPLARVTELLRSVDPLQSGERLEIPAAQSEAAELAQSYNEMLDQLEGERLESTRRVLSAQESERLWIAQELHDEVGQTLTGVLLGLTRLSRGAPAELAQPLALLAETTRSSIDDVRRIAQRLRPELLEDLGLAGALIALSRRMREQSELRIDCRIPAELAPQPPECELVIYRVAQEAMTNAIRHADARSLSVTLWAHPDRLTLSVRDDGRGLPDPRHEGGGMRGMRERAGLVGGRLRIASSPGAGAEVHLDVPLGGEGQWLG